MSAVSITTVLLIAFAVVGVAYSYFAARASARRTRALWAGIKQGRTESLAVVAVVAAIYVYVLVN